MLTLALDLLSSHPLKTVTLAIITFLTKSSILFPLSTGSFSIVHKHAVSSSIFRISSFDAPMSFLLSTHFLVLLYQKASQKSCHHAYILSWTHSNWTFISIAQLKFLLSGSLRTSILLNSVINFQSLFFFLILDLLATQSESLILQTLASAGF